MRPFIVSEELAHWLDLTENGVRKYEWSDVESCEVGVRLCGD